jgi:hypothetical protein
MNSTKVVVDIETVGKDLKNLDKITREYLEKQARRQNYTKEETEMKTSISPLTGEAVVIGMYNPGTQKGQIYYQAPGKKYKPYNKKGLEFIQGTEKEILELFWKNIKRFSSLITFNGRSFDIPYLITRSAIHKIKITKNLLPPRYTSAPAHVDLLDQMTFYQPWRGLGTLHQFCQAFNIKSPKEGEVDGYTVKKAFKDKKFKEIAEYNLQDLKATAELYEYWERYMRV